MTDLLTSAELEEIDVEIMDSNDMLPVKILSEMLYYHYANIAQLYAYSSGNHELVEKINYRRTYADNKRLLITVTNLQKQISELEKSLHTLIHS